MNTIYQASSGIKLESFSQKIIDPNTGITTSVELLSRPIANCGFGVTSMWFENQSVDEQLALIEHQLHLSVFIPYLTSINVSARLLHDSSTYMKFLSLLENSVRCQIEITEGFALPEMGLCNTLIQNIKSLGHEVALDDFTPEDKPLSVIGDYKFDVIKTDRSLLKNMTSEKAVHLLNTVIEQCKINGKKVILEGVETDQHDFYVRSLGDVMGQGYYYHMPEPTRVILDSDGYFGTNNHTMISRV